MTFSLIKPSNSNYFRKRILEYIFSFIFKGIFNYFWFIYTRENNINLWKDLEQRHSDISVLFEFAESGEIQDNEITSEIIVYEGIIRDLELKLMLGESQDVQDAIITIHPGAGGTESQDWADMLFRMYSRWIERMGFQKCIMDYQPGDEAGIKDITIEVNGDYAYGLLKAEAGIHRLV